MLVPNLSVWISRVTRLFNWWLSLGWSPAFSQAAAPCVSERASEAVAPGLEHLDLCRGEVAAAPGYHGELMCRHLRPA